MLLDVHHDYNEEPNNLLYIAPSKARGLGMFARSNIMSKTKLGYVGGYLICREEAQYADPTYYVDFENGRGGLVLNGSLINGDYCMLLNAASPNELENNNAAFRMREKQVLVKGRFVSKTLFMEGQYARFPVYSCRIIKKDEEVLVDYGKSYWNTYVNFVSKTLPVPQKKSIEHRNRRRTIREQSKVIMMDQSLDLENTVLLLGMVYSASVKPLKPDVGQPYRGKKPLYYFLDTICR
jgi:hypothetical protein